MGQKKAQAAIEFMSFFGFFALAFLFIASSLAEQRVNEIGLGKAAIAKELCLGLRNEVNGAFALGDGYWKTVEMKDYLGERYSARIKDGWVSVRLENEGNAFFTAPLAGGSVEGATDSEGIIVPGSGSFMIRNRGGTVVIER